MQKSQIRKLYREKRMSLAPYEYEGYNKAICRLFFETVNLASVRWVHSYLPVLERNEINTFMIIDELLGDQNIGLLAPKVLGDTMISMNYTAKDALERNAFGVLEPVGFIEAPQVPDLVITPLLAFDAQGYRVGYGGGYYDKYFATLPANVIKVGLSFFPSIDQIDDLDEFDMPLDLCITPKKVYEFKYGY